MVHHVGTISFDLLVGGDGTEDNLGKLAASEWSVGDSTGESISTASNVTCDSDLPNHFHRLLDNGQGHVCPVIDEPSNVVFRHLWELLLKYAFQPSEDHRALRLSVIVDDSEFYYTFAFLDDCWLFPLVRKDLLRDAPWDFLTFSGNLTTLLAVAAGWGVWVLERLRGLPSSVVVSALRLACNY
jgi:hypothetical protein